MSEAVLEGTEERQSADMEEVQDGPLLLPYGFARRFGVLLREKEGRQELCCRRGANLSALSEVQRWLGALPPVVTLALSIPPWR